MNKISPAIVESIKFNPKRPAKIYLASFTANFANGNSVGCANGLNILEIKENMLLNKECNCINRDHQDAKSKQKEGMK